MESLKLRIAQRAKRKELEEKNRDESPSQGTDENGSGSDEFDAAAWVDATVENIVAGLADLSDDELSAVEVAEAGKKNRVSAIDAIGEEKKKRAGSGAGWNASAG